MPLWLLEALQIENVTLSMLSGGFNFPTCELSAVDTYALPPIKNNNKKLYKKKLLVWSV